MSAPGLRHNAGDQLGRYRLLEPLGRGPLAEVWRATDTRAASPRHVALKVVSRVELADALREAPTLSFLRGPGIVPTLDVDATALPPVVALEPVRGGDLRLRLEEAEGGALPLPDALKVAERVIAAVALAHAEGAVHGAIRPENVLFDRDGEPHVTDFALSRELARRTALLSIPLSRTDSRFERVVEWLSPEQRRGELPTPRSDVWALGKLLRELISSTTELPDFLERALSRAQSEDPTSRQETANDLLHALRTGLADETRALRAEETRLEDRRALLRAWPGLWSGTIAVFALVAVLAALVDSSATDDAQALAVRANVLTAFLAAALPLLAIVPPCLRQRRALEEELTTIKRKVAALRDWSELSRRDSRPV